VTLRVSPSLGHVCRASLLPVPESKAAVLRWRAGQRAAEQRQRELLASAGPRPEQAVAEALAALGALEAMGMWPGPRDPVRERGVEILRSRWAKMGQRAKAEAEARTRRG
jgi:hypothetical protein